MVTGGNGLTSELALLPVEEGVMSALGNAITLHRLTEVKIVFYLMQVGTEERKKLKERHAMIKYVQVRLFNKKYLILISYTYRYRVLQIKAESLFSFL